MIFATASKATISTSPFAPYAPMLYLAVTYARMELNAHYVLMDMFSSPMPAYLVTVVSCVLTLSMDAPTAPMSMSAHPVT